MAAERAVAELSLLGSSGGRRRPTVGTGHPALLSQVDDQAQGYQKCRMPLTAWPEC